jgi:ferric enterobactin receptor
MTRLLLCVSSSLLAIHTVVSQPTPVPVAGTVRGIVLDTATTLPVLTALVIVRLNTDTSRVIRAQVGADGGFTVRGLSDGAYTMRVSALGYSPAVQSITISGSARTIEAGTIRMRRAAIRLETVQVQENADAMLVAADRNSYKARDIAPGAANASEVLEQTPSVQIDPDGKVSLRGNESVVVQVNGRPTPMTGVQLGAYLKSLSANVIDRVEVIPNPSAKYDPEGTAGIINLLLKANVDLGVSGGALLNAYNRDRYTLSGNLGYQRGKITSAFSASATNDVRGTPGRNALLVHDQSSAPVSFSNQNIIKDAGKGGQTISATVDYRTNTRDVWSNALTIGHSTDIDRSVTGYDEGRLVDLANDRFDRVLRSVNDGWLIDEDLAFKRTFVPRKHEWSAEVRYSHLADHESTDLWQERGGNRTAATAQLDREQQRIAVIARQFTAQSDYVRTIGKRSTLETGYRGSVRWYDRDLAVQQDSSGIGMWSISPKSNALTFRETVNAIYGVYSASLGKKVDATAGLRAEYADRAFTLANTARRYPYQYASAFPSGAVRFSPNDATQLRVSYSRRIRRPNADQLNPFPVFYDLQNVFLGNANLNPELTNSYDLNLTRTSSHGTLQVSPFFRQTTNVIRTVISTGDRVAGRDVTTFTYANIADSHAWGADINASLPGNRRVTGFASLNAFKTVVDGTPESSLSPTGFTWTGRLNGSARVGNTWLFNVAYIYRAEIPVVDGHFYRAQNTNITIRRKIQGERATIGLSIVDPFATNTFHILVRGPRIQQETERTLGLRGVFLRYQYNFGRPPKVREVREESEGAV